MALVMLLAAAMLPITRAAASTTVSGDADTNQSLTIDPGSGELTTQLDVNAALPVMFIQKMPVTKIVRQVTIGNFGLDPSCTGPSSLQLYVREHQDGDLDNSTQVSYSTTVPTVPAGAPARITWQIRDTKLMKGRGYSFRIQRNDTTDCRWLRTMTWGHNSSMVNPGPTTCANGPLVGNGSPMQRRMWHVAGVDDRFPGCVDRPSGSSSFEPTMPTGWLVSRYGSVWDSATAACLPSFCPPSPVVDYACKDNADDKLASDYGAEDVPYSPVLPDDKIHYVCRWGQWAPFGSTVPDGWYYAVPWIGGAGGAYPRDRYLRLDTIDYASYLQAYSPTLKYENTELYYADRAGEITDNYGARSYGSIYSNKLRTGDDGVLADANPNSGPFYPNGPWSFLSMDYLGSTYADGRQAASGDHIDEDNEDYQGDAAWMHDNGYGNYIYGRAVHDSAGKLWLQYWFFYYYNFVSLPPGDHEGDWEMVQVGLNNSLAADSVTFAEHDLSRSCVWTDVQKDTGTSSPVVYVSTGSHGSYPTSGVTNRYPLADDSHLGNGPKVRPGALTIHTASPTWVTWPGRWGATDVSPSGPADHSSWTDPKAFNENAMTCGGGWLSKRAARRIPPLPAKPRIHANLVGHAMRVRYVVPTGNSPRRHARAARIVIVVRGHDRLAAPRGAAYRLRNRRGKTTLALPLTRGPFSVIAVTLSRTGQRSRSVRVTVGHAAHRGHSSAR